MSDTLVPPSLHELKKLRQPIRSVNVEHRKTLSRLERLAIWITDRVGTMGQNLQGRHAEARAEADFQVNRKAEREIEAILLHLERQTDLILKVLRQLEGASKP